MRWRTYKFKTAQGNASEHLPPPNVGHSYKAGEDWRKWYPAKTVIPGVHAEDKIDAAYAGSITRAVSQPATPAILRMWARDGTQKVGAKTCAGCHDASYTVEKYMPGTGITVQVFLSARIRSTRTSRAKRAA